MPPLADYIAAVRYELNVNYGVRPHAYLAARVDRAIGHLHRRRRDIATATFMIANMYQRGDFHDKLS